MSTFQEPRLAEPATAESETPSDPFFTSTSISNEAGPSTSARGDGRDAKDAKDAKAHEKTISCVSCRRRKLKCDRVKPKCGTCIRLRHDCEYPERRRNMGSKRRNMKELEARLAQVETKLVSGSRTTPPEQSSAGPNVQMDWNNIGMDLDANIDLPGAAFDLPAQGFVPPAAAIPPTLAGDFLSSDLIALGLQEPLPPQDMIDELHEIFFDTFHHSMPIIHKARYLASLDRAPHMRPPICLRYAIWTIAASTSEKYMCIEDVFYERARRYIEAAEMKGHGETFVSVYHAQCWGLIGTYEAKKTYFSRAWVSVGRMVRLVQMLGLHRCDGGDAYSKAILPPSQDSIEMEERRRVFWASFYGDRWASSGTGWPMIIDERDVETNLPCNEEAFERGIPEPAISLQEALTAEGASKISPFAGVIISAALFGHNYEHLHHKGRNENPEDLANGEFWKRHRKMDNVLSNTFMFLPEHLRLPANIRNMNVVFLHMNVHASSICLHQAAVITATRCNLDPNFIRQCRARSLMAAEEISSIMRLVSHMDSSKMNSWMGFCLYVAGGVFIQDQRSEQPQPSSLSHLEFLMAAMQALGLRHPVTNHFTAQLELDMEAAGICLNPHPPPGEVLGCKKQVPNPSIKEQQVPNVPMNGILSSGNGKQMTMNELNAISMKSTDQPPATMGMHQSAGRAGSESTSGGEPIALTPLSGVLPGSDSTSSRASPAATNPFVPGSTWESGCVKGRNHSYKWNPNQTHPPIIGLGQNIGVSPPAQAPNDLPADKFPPAYRAFDQSLNTENTPSSNSSVSNNMQYPYRQAGPSPQNNSSSYAMFQPEPDPYTNPAEWPVPPEAFGGYENHDPLNDGVFDEYLSGAQDWVQHQHQQRR